MINKNLKFFCKKCESVQSPCIVIVFPEPTSDEPKPKGIETEVVITFYKRSSDKKIFISKIPDGEKIEDFEIFKGRKLECTHMISYYTPAFTDASSSNLNEIEIAQIRRQIDKEMIGKNKAEVEQTVLFQAEQYTVLLKIAQKQTQQSKYALQYIEQLKEKFASQLSDDSERKRFEERFAHFTETKSASKKTIDRERTSVEKTVDKQKAFLEQAKLLAKSKGFNLKDLFKSEPAKTPESPEQN